MSEGIPSPYVVSPEIKQLRQLLDQQRARVKSKPSETQHILITGESGVGKTAFATRYVALNPQFETEERTVIPVGYSVVRSSGSIPGMLRGLLSACGDVRDGKGSRSVHVLFRRLVAIVETVQMEVLFIDEAGTAVQSQTGSARFRRLEFFKDLMSELGVCIVFLGPPWLRAIFAESTQAYERIALHRELSVFRISDSRSRELYFRFLLELSKIRSVSIDTDPSTSLLGYQIYAYAKGRQRRVIEVFNDAIDLALSEGSNVCAQHFANVVSQRGDPNESNPFQQDIKQLWIEEPSAGSRYRFDASASKPREIGQVRRRLKLVKDGERFKLFEDSRDQP